MNDKKDIDRQKVEDNTSAYAASGERTAEYPAAVIESLTDANMSETQAQVIAEVIDALRMQMDNRFIKFEGFMIESFTLVRDYTKAGFAKVDKQFDKVDEQFAEARSYTDEKFAEARSYTDEKFAEARSYTDEKFAKVDEQFVQVNDRLKSMEIKLASLGASLVYVNLFMGGIFFIMLGIAAKTILQ